jgi:hypothetical protein
VLGRAVRPIEGPVICTNKTRKYERGGNIVLVHIISKDREKEREETGSSTHQVTVKTLGVVRKIEVE